MSKQQIFVRHKDEIMLEIIRLQRLVFCDDQVEAEAVNHGKIQGLMWSAGLYNNKDESSDTFNQWDDLDERGQPIFINQEEENKDANES